MTPRPYAMTVRAATAEQTREQILDATIALALETQRLDFSLDQVAERSGRSVQTILRRFGSRDGLIEQATAHGSAQVAADRRPATPGDVPGALALLLEHYEQWGRFMLRLLARADAGSGDTTAPDPSTHDQDARDITAGGRLLHRGWVTEVFAPDSVELTDLLVVATDLSTWKLLRLDRGLSPRETLARMTALTDAVLATRTPRSARPTRGAVA